MDLVQQVLLEISGPVPNHISDRVERIEAAWGCFLACKGLLTPVTHKVRVSLSFVDREAMKRLNLDYRGINSETDVLSFPLWEGEDGFCPPEWEDLPLGDVVVCPSAVEDLDGSHEMGLLLVIHHGFLHLLGYDHGDELQREAMWALQDDLVRLTL